MVNKHETVMSHLGQPITNTVQCVAYAGHVCACGCVVLQSIPLSSVYVLSMYVHESVVCRNPHLRSLCLY